MRRLFDTMAGRVTLVLVAGVVVAATLTQLFAESERIRAAAQARDGMVLDRSDQVLREVQDIARDRRSTYLAATNKQGARLDPETQRAPVAPQPSPFAQALAARMGPGYTVQSLWARPPSCLKDVLQATVFGPVHMPFKGICESVSVALPDGDRIRITVTPPGVPRPQYPNYMLGIAMFLFSTVLLAFWVVHMTVRPLQDLAKAALRLGKDINQPPLPIAGVAEIRQATTAFNTMQGMLREYIRQRTEMLAAITHDLQTPLTRMRFRLEKVQDEELKDQLLGDLTAVLTMVREGLDLARSTDTNEPMQAMDLDSLLDSVCSDASEAGQPVTLQGQSGSVLVGRPLALRRCLTNLIDNAVKHGKQADVSIERVDGAVLVRIRDQGPGIDDEELERVFDPFYRVESSRSRKSGGTGLGLTIARNIAVQHKGNIVLANMATGGLEVTLSLPDAGANT